MVAYDPKIISQFAERTYKKANSIITRYALIGFAVGFLLFFLIGSSLGRSSKPGGGDGALIFLLLFLWGICTLVGLDIGRSKAFALKLQAQTALVMVKIEENTRATVAAATMPAVPGLAQ